MILRTGFPAQIFHLVIDQKLMHHVAGIVGARKTAQPVAQYMAVHGKGKVRMDSHQLIPELLAVIAAIVFQPMVYEWGFHCCAVPLAAQSYRVSS